MQKDKHNIYSKEELLKLIKEGKNAPADMDEFDLEALEGLKSLDKPGILNKLNKEVDEIIISEKKKENQRKTIYYFSAAASLLLIVGLIFFFKNEVVVENDKVVAEAEKPKEEKTQLDLVPPAQAEATTTYEAKEPEQEKTAKKETFVLAESKIKKQETELANLEQTISTKNLSGGIAKDDDVKRKEETVGANQAIVANSAAPTAYKETQEHDESKQMSSDKAKKTAAANQTAMAFESRDQNNVLEQAPSAPKADSKKAEKKAQPDMFYANSLAKSKTLKNFKEPTFISGDSAFVDYVKQNLKISSPNNSGIIVVEFLVKKNGTATDIRILKPLSTCDACSKDVIDFIKSIKKWQPAVEGEKAISAPKKLSIQYN
jgi:chemotaxis protein histidine kinase CheA